MRQAIHQTHARFAEFTRNWRERIGRHLKRFADFLEPASARQPWIKLGVLGGVLSLGCWIGAESLNLPFGLLANMAAGMVIALILLGLAMLVLGPGLGLIRLLHRWFTPVGLVAVVATIALLTLITLSPPLALVAGLVVGVAFVLVGLGIGLLRTDPRRVVAGGACLAVAALVIVSALIWILGEQSGEDPVATLVTIPGHDGKPFDQYLERGPYETDFLTYGSGKDRWREEYADGVSWKSESVDAHDMLDRPSGLGLRLRERFWGFGLDALPVNGRVWYPSDAPGRLPIVLIVHGNHDMMHYSDPGYEWLGEHLASRGHIVVSVDQNFINGGLFGGVSRENGVRGWLLLEHLAAWREWQQAPTHPLHEQVDLDQVVLIGHSRGGEAVALAAAFNRLDRFPEDARIEFDFDFGIQGVAAIAPVDGQFWTSGKPTELGDVSYFVIHGGMDADVSLFLGNRQLVRTRPDPVTGRFSASLYVHHANHGQFNTVWGDNDTGMIARYMLNRAWLMPGEEQRRVGLLYLTAFVENSLERSDEMPDLFCNPDSAGRLLPETLYVARCFDGLRVVLADFEDGIDLTRSSRDGVTLEGRDLDQWAERDIGFRGNSQRRQTGVFLGWHAAENGADNALHPAYRVELETALHESIGLGEDSTLWLDLAHADRDPPPRMENDQADNDQGPDDRQNNRENNRQNDQDDQATEKTEGEALRPRLNITVVLHDVDGNQAGKPLSDFADLLPPLPVRHTRLDLINKNRYHSATEPLLKSVAIPLIDFAAAGVRLDRLRSIELQFDNSESGVLIIERIAITPGSGPEIP